MSPIERYALKNGLRVYLKKNESKEIVSCGIWVNQGAKDESNYENGLSHLVEHLMFKIDSSESKDSIEEIQNKLIECGSIFNASTNKESTSFYIQGLSTNLEMFIESLSYIVSNKKKIEKTELEKEKKIVLREAEEFFRSSSQMADKVGQVMWGNNSYGNMVIGNEENIKSFTCRDVDSLISNVYTPDNSVLVVSGDFNVTEVKKNIERYFSKWTGVCKKDKKHIPESKSGIIVDNSFGGDRTTIAIGFPGYSDKDIRFQYLELLKNIMVSPNSRLLVKLREEMGLVYSLRGFTNAFSEAGNIGLVFSANNECVKNIIKVIVEEIRNLKIHGVEKKIFENLKKIRLLEVLISNESSLEEMKCIGMCAINGEEFLVEKDIQDIKSLDITVMNEVINDVFKKEKLCVAVLGSVDIDEIRPLLVI